MTNDDERAAREWLANASAYEYEADGTREDDTTNRAVLFRLLDRTVIPTSEEERKAREWLQNKADHSPHPHAKTCATILRLLDRPVLPRGADVPDDVLSKMMQGFWDSPGGYQGGLRAAIDVLHAHLTAPPPVKKVEVWAVVDATGQRVLCRKQSDAEYWRGIYSGSRVVKLVEAADDQ